MSPVTVLSNTPWGRWVKAFLDDSQWGSETVKENQVTRAQIKDANLQAVLYKRDQWSLQFSSPVTFSYHHLCLPLLSPPTNVLKLLIFPIWLFHYDLYRTNLINVFELVMNTASEGCEYVLCLPCCHWVFPSPVRPADLDAYDESSHRYACHLLQVSSCP